MYGLVDLCFDLLVFLNEVLILANSERSRLKLPVLLNEALQMLSAFLSFNLPLPQLFFRPHKLV